MTLKMTGTVGGKDQCHVELKEMMIDDDEDGKFARW